MMKAVTFVALCCILFVEGKTVSSLVSSHHDGFMVPSSIKTEADLEIDPAADEQWVADLSTRFAREAQMGPFNPADMAAMGADMASKFGEKAMQMAGQIAEKFQNPSEMMNVGSMVPS